MIDKDAAIPVVNLLANLVANPFANLIGPPNRPTAANHSNKQQAHSGLATSSRTVAERTNEMPWALLVSIMTDSTTGWLTG
ncbi:hypothetical protein K239x_31320 [Planctomycetes bacterium K23_9]|uniref:Uncharacterized protein n=1 Tax=Stieleria marina TaxID=1930275 RepID=A0A517NVH9_9BACT|nr:hypothetical protein K239x_31320 [Planctomycetes bacterium K23_9]